MMCSLKQWIVLFISVAVVGMAVFTVAQSDGPAFFPKQSEPAWPQVVMEPEISTGQEILGGTGRNMPDMFPAVPLADDPITILPHVIYLANRYGILQCITILIAIYFFQYVKTAQGNSHAREEFYRQQLNYSDKRTTEELTRLSSKLSLMEQDFRALQDKFDRHGELIRANGPTPTH